MASYRNNKMEEGHWDYDVLNNQYEPEMLQEIGFSEAQLTDYAPVEKEKKEKGS